jgi:hypothetical protein
MNNNKMSFTEIVNNFTEKHGKDWCNNSNVSESVADAFIDYLMSISSQQFDYEKVNNLK